MRPTSFPPGSRVPTKSFPSGVAVFRRGKSVVGLDLGSQVVKAIEITLEGPEPVITGFARVEVDATISDPLLGTISVSDSGNELAMGAGFNFKIGEKLAIRAEYETFDTADSMDVLSAGAILRF